MCSYYIWICSRPHGRRCPRDAQVHSNRALHGLVPSASHVLAQDCSWLANGSGSSFSIPSVFRGFIYICDHCLLFKTVDGGNHFLLRPALSGGSGISWGAHQPWHSYLFSFMRLCRVALFKPARK